VKFFPCTRAHSPVWPPLQVMPTKRRSYRDRIDSVTSFHPMYISVGTAALKGITWRTYRHGGSRRRRRRRRRVQAMSAHLGRSMRCPDRRFIKTASMPLRRDIVYVPLASYRPHTKLSLITSAIIRPTYVLYTL